MHDYLSLVPSGACRLMVCFVLYSAERGPVPSLYRVPVDYRLSWFLSEVRSLGIVTSKITPLSEPGRRPRWYHSRSYTCSYYRTRLHLTALDLTLMDLGGGNEVPQIESGMRIETIVWTNFSPWISSQYASQDTSIGRWRSADLLVG
jgi:hypothetical protein